MAVGGRPPLHAACGQSSRTQGVDTPCTGVTHGARARALRGEFREWLVESGKARVGYAKLTRPILRLVLCDHRPRSAGTGLGVCTRATQRGEERGAGSMLRVVTFVVGADTRALGLLCCQQAFSNPGLVQPCPPDGTPIAE